MLFSSRKPLYFVFHDRSERYFQDSTLQLTFSEWLWLTLRKRGYSNIYFVDLDDTGRPVLTLRDRDTWRGYTPGGIFSVMEEYRGRPLRRVMGDKEFLRLWNRIYDGPGDCAYVFSAQAFSRLASVRRPKDVDGLLDRMARQERPDALILTGPMDMEASDLDAYLNPHGILAYLSPTGRSLCQAAADLLQREQDVCFFEKLKERLGDQFIELGRPTYGRLLSMLRCLCFRLDKPWGEENLRFYAMLLQRWLYMNNVRAAYPELLTGFAPPYTCAAIYKRLLSDGEADKLSRYGDALLGAAPDPALPERLLDQRFGQLPREALDRSHIVMDDSRLYGLLQLNLPNNPTRLQDDGFDICPVYSDDWDRMKRNLRSPRLCPPPSEALESIAKVLDIYRNARKYEDHRTVRRSLCVLLCFGQWLYEVDCKADKHVAFEDVEAYLKRSEKYFQMVKHKNDNRREDLTELAAMLDRQDTVFWEPDPKALQRLGEKAKEAKRETLNGYRSFLQEQSEGR